MLDEIRRNVIDGQVAQVEAGVTTVLASGCAPDAILKDGLIAAMDEVGQRFEEGDFFVPEMLASARAMKAGLQVLKPHLVTGETRSAGRVALGTVQGDIHDIGKNLVCMMLEGAGFEVVDLGVDVSPNGFVQAVKDGAKVIGMSALLTTTMGNMITTIEALKAAGLRDKVKVMIGGAPVTEEYAQRIGADASARDASSATRIARILAE